MVERMIEENKVKKPKVQNLLLENREKLGISGVIDVESFNDECVVVGTEMGLLIVRGIDLHINKLDLESSELDIEGDIASIEYSEQERARSGGSFFSKMFR